MMPATDDRNAARSRNRAQRATAAAALLLRRGCRASRTAACVACCASARPSDSKCQGIKG